MIQGRYLSSGCSKLWCDWRDGKTCATPTSESRRELLEVFKQIRDRVVMPQPEPSAPELPGRLGAVRRLLESRERRILELEASLTSLWEKNALLHDRGQSFIDDLERRIVELEDSLQFVCADNTKNAARAERLAKEIKSKRAVIEQLRGRRQRRKLRLRQLLFGHGASKDTN